MMNLKLQDPAQRHFVFVEYGVHLRTKIIENKIQFEVQKLDYPCRNLVI